MLDRVYPSAAWRCQNGQNSVLLLKCGLVQFYLKMTSNSISVYLTVSSNSDAAQSDMPLSWTLI